MTEPVDRSARSATEYYAALRRQSMVRRWLVATTIGAAIGLFTNLVLAWPLALLIATVAAAALMIWDHFHGTIADWWPHTPRAHRLAAIAARLERHGWAALPAPAAADRDRALATYLLIGPSGVFVIDHQVWWVPDTVTTDPATGLLMVGGKPAARRVTSVKGAAAAVAHTLAHHLPDPATVHPVLTVDGPMLRHQQLVAGVTIVPIADLPTFLANRDIVLHPNEITMLAEHARRLYPSR